MRKRISSNCAGALWGGAITALSLTVTLAWTHAADVDPRQTPPSQPLIEGKQIFQTKGCAGCHNIRGAEGEKRPGPDLGRSGSWRDIMQFTGALWDHTPKMMALMREQGVQRPTLSPDEIGKLASYLFYVRFFDEPGTVARGREVFEQRSCARCHQVQGRGGTMGPRLDELKDFASSFFLAQALWNHGPEMAVKMADLKLERPQLESDDVAQIVALIRGDAGRGEALELAYAQVGNPQVGKTLFREKRCIQCHAIGGAGGSVGPDLGTRQMPHIGAMAAALWNHGPAMWAKMKENGVPFPRLSDREMSDLLAYLYFAQYMGQSGNAARGAALFREKSCFGCHAVAGVGPGIGPDLARSDAVRSPLQLASALWNHAPVMEAKIQQAQTPWPRFEDDEMRDLVEFLRSRGDSK